MNKRKIALACIVSDVFENGKLTRIGIDAYIRGRISRQTLSTAMAQGQRLREKALREGQSCNASTYCPMKES